MLAAIATVTIVSSVSFEEAVIFAGRGRALHNTGPRGEYIEACTTLCDDLINGTDPYCAICGGDDCNKAANNRPCCGHLGVGDGDCDSDRDCLPGLVCGTDNCGEPYRSSVGWPVESVLGWDTTDDCCEVPREDVAAFTATCAGNDCNKGTNNPACCSHLGVGDGDCDRDSDCLPGLVCGKDNCGEPFRSSSGWPTESLLGWDTTDDCCVVPEPPHGYQTNFCSVCGGHDCNNATTNPECCSKLGVGDGDCDRDSDCLPGLTCGTDNCGAYRSTAGWPAESQLSWDTTDDCCFVQSRACGGHDCNDGANNPECCSMLGVGDGDCDSDHDCLPGLACGTDNCGDYRNHDGWPVESQLGWDSTDDCCFIPPGGGGGGGFGMVVLGMLLGAIVYTVSLLLYRHGYCVRLCGVLAPLFACLPQALRPETTKKTGTARSGGGLAAADQYASYRDAGAGPIVVAPPSGSM